MKLRTFLTCSVLALLSGCYDTEKPLSNSADSEADDRLLGGWGIQKDGEFIPRMQIRSLRGGLMLLCLFEHHENGSVSVQSTHVAFRTQLDGKNYLNVTQHFQPGAFTSIRFGGKSAERYAKGYGIVKYSFRGDKLLFQRMTHQAKAEAINGGRIKGVISKPQLYGDTGSSQFKDTSDNVAALVAAEHDTLFGETSTLIHAPDDIDIDALAKRILLKKRIEWKAYFDREAAYNASFRTWTDATGRFKVEARFAGFINGTVILESRDGTEHKVRLDQLSEDDRAIIKQKAQP